MSDKLLHKRGVSRCFLLTVGLSRKFAHLLTELRHDLLRMNNFSSRQLPSKIFDEFLFKFFDNDLFKYIGNTWIIAQKTKVNCV